MRRLWLFRAARADGLSRPSCCWYLHGPPSPPAECGGCGWSLHGPPSPSARVRRLWLGVLMVRAVRPTECPCVGGGCCWRVESSLELRLRRDGGGRAPMRVPTILRRTGRVCASARSFEVCCEAASGGAGETRAGAPQVAAVASRSVRETDRPGRATYAPPAARASRMTATCGHVPRALVRVWPVPLDWPCAGALPAGGGEIAVAACACGTACGGCYPWAGS